MLTQERLKELLDYDPETGVFVRKKNVRGGFSIGDIAGTINDNGYRIINIDGKRYRAHRLAWLYVYGVHPSAYLDHINRDRSDNRINNLREVNKQQNSWNHGGNIANTSGFTGVSWHKKSNKWRAAIRVNYVQRALGYFDTKEEAHAAYVQAKVEHHNF